MNNKVKGFGASTFDDKDVANLTKWGNKKAAKYWLANHSKTQYPIPDRTNAVRMKEFMKLKYEEKRFCDRDADLSDGEEESRGRSKKKKKRKQVSDSDEEEKESDSASSEERPQHRRRKKKASKLAPPAPAPKTVKTKKAKKKRKVTSSDEEDDEVPKIQAKEEIKAAPQPDPHEAM